MKDKLLAFGIYFSRKFHFWTGDKVNVVSKTGKQVY